MAVRFSKSDFARLKAKLGPGTVVQKRKPAHVRGVKNKTEQRYCDHLGLRKLAGEISWFHFETVTLLLAHDVRSIVDCIVGLPDGSIEVHEIKGGQYVKRESGERVVRPYSKPLSKAKLSLIAELFPFRCFLVYDDPQTKQWYADEYPPKGSGCQLDAAGVESLHTLFAKGERVELTWTWHGAILLRSGRKWVSVGHVLRKAA